ncbi:MAG TPA: LapA family protein [Ktedonobacterales bacterium]|jgi:uncharacterized integral membrane protein|nr:LapA family protein [Ktedonobacterales bacterium]
MRVFISLLVGVVAIVLVVGLAIFAVQNIEPVPLRFLPYSFTGSVWGIAVGSAVLGFLVALLLALPGRLAEIWHDRSMTQQMEQAAQELSDAHRRRAGADAARRESQQQSQRLQTQLRQFVSEREELVAERDRLRAERNKLRHQLAITQFELDTAPTMAAMSTVDTPPWASPHGFDEPVEDVDVDVDAEPLDDPEDVAAVPTPSATDASPAAQPKRAGGRRKRHRPTPHEDEEMDTQPLDDVSAPASVLPPQDSISASA